MVVHFCMHRRSCSRNCDRSRHSGKLSQNSLVNGSVRLSHANDARSIACPAQIVACPLHFGLLRFMTLRLKSLHNCQPPVSTTLWRVDLSLGRPSLPRPLARQGCSTRLIGLQRSLKIRAIGFDLGTETGKGKTCFMLDIPRNCICS